LGGVFPLRGNTAQAEGETLAHVDHTCASAISGRRAARVLAEWAKRFGLSEAELQLLWRLRAAPDDGFDQTSLASALAFSPAQISASVERLRVQGSICPSGSVADRRRRHWRLSATGRELLEQMVVAETLLRCQGSNELSVDLSGRGREAAA
jgi:DNA-binding MarR family transcriptional regulator